MFAAQSVTTEEFIEADRRRIMAGGVDCAVESWMAQMDEAVNDTHLTTLGRCKR